MKGQDPRDAHFITSRIRGICGDNHATCACYAQNMAFGVRPPNMGEWIVNLGEAAEYMFDHCIFQDNLVGVDFCEQMVKETNPSVWARAQRTPAPHANDHGYRTIADIMTALNPFVGEFYREALVMSRWKIPRWSNAIERNRARTYFQAYAAAAALYFAEQAMKDLHQGSTRTWREFKVPEEAIGCGFHEAVRGVLSHHVVIRDGKIANYHPYPPTPWNASPRDIYYIVTVDLPGQLLEPTLAAERRST
jgi:Ni,Fe-hydrogenase I large subunit